MRLLYLSFLPQPSPSFMDAVARQAFEQSAQRDSTALMISAGVLAMGTLLISFDIVRDLKERAAAKPKRRWSPVLSLGGLILLIAGLAGVGASLGALRTADRRMRELDREAVAHAASAVARANAHAVQAEQEAASSAVRAAEVMKRANALGFENARLRALFAAVRPSAGRVDNKNDQILAENSTLMLASPPESPAEFNHRSGPYALSAAQMSSLCTSLRMYRGEQVYIQWGSDAASQVLAKQLTTVLKCAEVTLTWSGEGAELLSGGVTIASHGEEGETSVRLRPLLNALIAGLRAQGLAVRGAALPEVPSDQTAIFIGQR